MSADFAARGLALAARRSPATRALVEAVRTLGFHPQPLTRCPVGDVPALTLGAAGAASALNGRSLGNPLVLLTDPRLKWLAGPTTLDGSGAWQPRGAWYGSGRASQYASIEFIHTGSDLELCVVGSFASATSNIRVLVNDRIAALTTVPFNTGSYYYLRLTFPASSTRRIRIESAGGKLRGVNVANASEIAATGRSYPLIAVMGDSFPEATGANPVMDGEGAALVRALGGNVILGAVGGTGLLNPGTGGKVAWTDAVRLGDLTMSGVSDALGQSVTPMLGIVMASINDQGAASAWWNGAASFEAAIAKATYTVIEAWLAANPGRPLVWFGPTWTTGTPPLDVFRIRDAVRDACWAYATSNVWFLDRLDAAPVLRGGARSSTSTTGTTANTSVVLTALASTAGVVIGSGAIGPGLPDGTRVVSVDSATQVTLSNAAIASASGVSLTFKNDQAAHYTNLQASDGTHPDQRGHTLDALWMAQQVRRLILTEFA
jgi:hypothetical protein